MPTAQSVHDNGNAVFLKQLREIAGREPAVVIGAEEFRRTMTMDRLLHRPRENNQELPHRRFAAESIRYGE